MKLSYLNLALFQALFIFDAKSCAKSLKKLFMMLISFDDFISSRVAQLERRFVAPLIKWNKKKWKECIVGLVRENQNCLIRESIGEVKQKKLKSVQKSQK